MTSAPLNEAVGYARNRRWPVFPVIGMGENAR